jgi:hypothetical protein
MFLDRFEIDHIRRKKIPKQIRKMKTKPEFKIENP